MSSRDWGLSKLEKLENIDTLQPVGDKCIQIHRKDSSKYPPFTTAIISTATVTCAQIFSLQQGDNKIQFVTNIPKAAIWTGDAIAAVRQFNLGWGSFGDLMSVLGEKFVEGFQKKEFKFVERGLQQHSTVSKIDRLFDRIIEVHRGELPSIKTVLLNEYELTAERIRFARENYGDFSAILCTNPNSRVTGNAHQVANQLGAEIFHWGEFLGRLNRP